MCISLKELFQEDMVTHICKNRMANIHFRHIMIICKIINSNKAGITKENTKANIMKVFSATVSKCSNQIDCWYPNIKPHSHKTTLKSLPCPTNILMYATLCGSNKILYILTLTLTLKIVYLDTTDILQLNYYVQHICNKKIIYIGCAKETI